MVCYVLFIVVLKVEKKIIQRINVNTIQLTIFQEKENIKI